MALLLLFRRHCDDCKKVMQDIVSGLNCNEAEVLDVCIQASQSFEILLVKNFSANRAMYELYLEDLEVHEMTKEIFLDAVNMMRCIQKKYLKSSGASDLGAFAAAQLMVTINYNFVMKAMPAMPMNRRVRQQLIGRIMVDAIVL